MVDVNKLSPAEQANFYEGYYSTGGDKLALAELNLLGGASAVTDIVDVAAGGLKLLESAGERVLSKFGLFREEGEIANYGASNHINGLRLQRSLMLEQAKSIFTPSGELTPEVIDSSRMIQSGEKLKNAALLENLSKMGGEIHDWGKYSTVSSFSPSGNFEMHFYYNPVIKEVYYGMDYKAVFEHQGTWDFEPQPNFDYEPLKFNP